MIQAILRNKINSEIRDYFKIKEDTLTSSVIGNLLLLPSNFFLEILSKAAYEKFDYTHYGNLQFHDFWPHWDSQNTSNSNFVEPDVFLSFDNVDIIIEAKRYDDYQQYRKQWENEIISYYNEYGKENKNLVFFAIGGINSIKTENLIIENKEIKIYKIRWKRILYEVDNVTNAIYKIKPYSENANTLIRILQVIKQSFELHGFLSIKWFKEMKVDFIINDRVSINEWIPNRNYFFNLKNDYQINQENIKQWKQ